MCNSAEDGRSIACRASQHSLERFNKRRNENGFFKISRKWSVLWNRTHTGSGTHACGFENELVQLKGKTWERLNGPVYF